MIRETILLRIRQLVCVLIVLALPLITNSSNVIAQGTPTLQEKHVALVSDETYQRVLNLLFPLDTPKINFEYAWLIRFTPSYGANSQIIIIKRTTNIEITEYTSLDGNIRSKLDEILKRTGREDAGEMAKQFRIARRVMSIPDSKIQQWRKSFARYFYMLLAPEKIDSRDKTGTGTLFLHGSLYELRYIGETGKITYRVYGSEVGSKHSPKDSPLVLWMDNVRKVVRNLTTNDQ